MIERLETEIGGRKIVLETGKYGLLSDAAITLSYGDTVVLTNVNISDKPRDGIDFFPLSVEYEERLYSVGKIPGGFIKREGRPSENAILNGRAIDRPLRPLFPDGLRNDVQIVCTVVSVENDNEPDILAINAASIACCISSIPFITPVAAVSIGLIDGEFIVNPTSDQRLLSQMALTICATKERVMMIEAGANEIDEKTMIDGIEFGFNACQKLIAFQEEAVAKFGKEKIEVKQYEIDPEFKEKVIEKVTEDIKKAMYTVDKDVRNKMIDEIKEKTVNEFEEEYPGSAKDIGEIIYKIQKKTVRNMILVDKRRPDERKFNEVRPLTCEVGLLPRVHGSGMFRRGLTQVLAVATLGALSEVQTIDGIGEETQKRYMHQYNFPGYSVGEVKPLRGPGRREIGHGALAERALVPLMPSEEEFPYAIRVVSEVLTSNGSTSQASVCASTLALLHAGVPLKRPAAGIAMGLVTSDDLVQEEILTDIQGIEDFFGDMDFKVAGTSVGITSIQVDTKIKGLSKTIIENTIRDAKIARTHILSKMEEAIKEPNEMSKYAPRVYTIQIDPDKIRTVIGAGGKTINKIIAETEVKIDINDEGRICVMSENAENVERAIKIITDLTKDVKVNETYLGKVTKIMNFGAFVEILPGKEGLVHISKLDKERVNKVEDVVSIGDEILVKVTEIDPQGRINLSRKDAMVEDESK